MSAEACPHGCLPRSRCTDCSYHDTLKSADHGISPAQLREKVEALEKRIQNVDEGVSDYIDDFKNTLDAALKRIENLERDMGDVHPNALSGAKT